MKGGYEMRARKNNRFPAGRGAELRAASNPVRGDPERRTESNPCRGDPLEQEVQKELLFLSIKEELIKAGLIKMRGKSEKSL